MADIASIMLIINLVSEGIGVAKELKDLADRVKAGEKITDEEIENARNSINEAIANFESS